MSECFLVKDAEVLFDSLDEAISELVEVDLVDPDSDLPGNFTVLVYERLDRKIADLVPDHALTILWEEIEECCPSDRYGDLMTGWIDAATPDQRELFKNDIRSAVAKWSEKTGVKPNFFDTGDLLRELDVRVERDGSFEVVQKVRKKFHVLAKVDRNSQIYDMRTSGAKFTDLAVHFGINPGRVRQIYRLELRHRLSPETRNLTPDPFSE